jgi:hypothetical protein
MYQNNENITGEVKKNRDFTEKVLKGNEEGLQLMFEEKTKQMHERIDILEEELLLAKAIEEEWHHMLNKVEAQVDGDTTRKMNERIDNLDSEVEAINKKLKQNENDKKLSEELANITKDVAKQKQTTDEVQIKSLMDNMMNKLEFQMIVGNVNEKIVKNEETGKQILEKLSLFNEQVTKIDKDITKKSIHLDVEDVLESKISDALERLKQENHDMWVNAVELSQSVNTPDGKII